MPTHKHIFSNHGKGYGHLNIAHVRSLAYRQKTESSTVLALTQLRTAVRLYILNLLLSLFDQVT
jgi:hypothetical protein